MKTPNPFVLVIFGGSGDLSHRKLFPALFKLYEQQRLPDQFKILALGRRTFSDTEFRDQVFADIPGAGNIKLKKSFIEQVHFQYMDISDSTDFQKLNERIAAVADSETPNILFYLATPPSFFAPVSRELAALGLDQETEGIAWRRIILEKPFGTDYHSAENLNKALMENFAEDQVYRIDHYLGKETVQNILAFRFANGIFQPLWNRRHIQRIEITSAESLGVEDRGGYYDTSGALRDMIQNHLLQLLAVIAMEPPARFDSNAIRGEKVKVLEALRPIKDSAIPEQVIRGQYISSKVRGKTVKGYRNELNVNPESSTETFVAIKAFIDNERWAGIPFYIRTGKQLPTRVSEVVIHFNGPGHQLFSELASEDIGENQLVIRIQPDEGVLLKFGLKVPGAGFKIARVGMDFHYSDLKTTELPEAYERLILDALTGDNTLYARSDAVLAAWDFVDPILEYWKAHPKTKLYGYPAGTWGPPESTELFEEKDEDWRYPCSNLSSDDTFCEL